MVRGHRFAELQFFLKTLTKSENIIHNWKKKWLAIFLSLKQLWCTFHPFHPFVVYDHNTVTFIRNMQNKNHILTMGINVARIQFDYKILSVTIVVLQMLCLELDNIVMNWNKDVLQKVCIQTFASREEMLCIYYKYEILLCSL